MPCLKGNPVCRDQLLVAKIHVVEWSKLKKNRFDNTLLKVMNYTITNWRVSLSKICHEWPNNAVTHECEQRMSELQR